MKFNDPADAWDAYCAETPRGQRSPQGALAFGFHAAPSCDADLVKKLEPFAKACEAAAWPTFECDNTLIDTSFGLTVGDLRAARAALAAAKGAK